MDDDPRRPPARRIPGYEQLPAERRRLGMHPAQPFGAPPKDENPDPDRIRDTFL